MRVPLIVAAATIVVLLAASWDPISAGAVDAQSIPANVPSAPPAPHGAVPSAAQLSWHEMEMYAFMHFGPNTFTGREWGLGNEDPSVFSPTDFDAMSIVKVFKSAGFRGVVLTAKHHDGFCLWPSKTTNRTVAASPFRGGAGDVVAEVAAACQAHGLKFGVYVSPWDRSNALYGTREYVTEIFRKQLAELLSRYPDIFYVWLDSAHAGCGMYGGREKMRRVDVDFSTYFEWDETLDQVRRLAKNAVVFSNSGPDIRWIGNERGEAGEKVSWMTWTPSFNNGSAIPGRPAPAEADPPGAPEGTRDGRYWMPPEADVSIRKGWFHHREETSTARDPARLRDLYLASVGRGASLHLNVPPDRSGRLDPVDVRHLERFGAHLRTTFHSNLAARAVVTAANVRGGDSAAARDAYGPHRVVDDDPWSAWVTDDGVSSSSVTMSFGGDAPVRFNVVRLREDIRVGQRIDWFAVAYKNHTRGWWKTIVQGERTIGPHRIVSLSQTVSAVAVRVSVASSAHVPTALSHAGLYLQPDLPYESVRGLPLLPRKGWAVSSTSHAAMHSEPWHVLDGKPTSYWSTNNATNDLSGRNGSLPQAITVELPQTERVFGFVVTPPNKPGPGTVSGYVAEVESEDGTWRQAAQGEFGNVRNNPVDLDVIFAGGPVSTKRFRLTATAALEGDFARLAELNLIAGIPSDASGSRGRV